ENFGRNWKKKMFGDTESLATNSSRKGRTSKAIRSRLSLQKKNRLGTDFQKQVQALLENKASPHVIAVIEGKDEKASFSLKSSVGDESIDVSYTRINYVQGTNAKGSKD